MVSKKKVLKQFIDSIPDSKLDGFPNSQKTLYRDDDLRLDMKGVTGNNEWNLQVQVNKKPKTTSLRKYAPDTVAGPVLVSMDNPKTPEEIREAFKKSSEF